MDQDFLCQGEYKAKIRAVSIDSSDGQTNDAVYSYVRARRQKGYMAVKGSSVNDDSKEIFTTPKVSVDLNGRYKATRFGVKPFIVGTSRAKDLILGVDANGGRVKLTGDGPGRLHWYKNVRPDYFEQLTSEVKAPKGRGLKRVWQKKSGVRNEALDCEVYALHAARSLRLHLWKKERWETELAEQKQLRLFSDEDSAPAPHKNIEKQTAPKTEVENVAPPAEVASEPPKEAPRDDFFRAFENQGDYGW